MRSEITMNQKMDHKRSKPNPKMVAAGKKAAKGTLAEKTVAKWLGEHGFCNIERNPKPTGCWDVKARKGKCNWVVEVKTGNDPKINLANFEKMTNMKGYTKIGLALVTKNYVHLLEYPKMRWAAYKAWKTRKSQRK